MKSLKSYNENVLQPAERWLKNLRFSSGRFNSNNPLPTGPEWWRKKNEKRKRWRKKATFHAGTFWPTSSPDNDKWLTFNRKVHQFIMFHRYSFSLHSFSGSESSTITENNLKKYIIGVARIFTWGTVYSVDQYLMHLICHLIQQMKNKQNSAIHCTLRSPSNIAA